MFVDRRVCCIADGYLPCAEHLIDGRSSGTLRYLNSKRGVLNHHPRQQSLGRGPRVQHQRQSLISIANVGDYEPTLCARKGVKPWGAAAARRPPPSRRDERWRSWAPRRAESQDRFSTLPTPFTHRSRPLRAIRKWAEIELPGTGSRT